MYDGDESAGFLKGIVWCIGMFIVLILVTVGVVQAYEWNTAREKATSCLIDQAKGFCAHIGESYGSLNQLSKSGFSCYNSLGDKRSVSFSEVEKRWCGI